MDIDIELGMDELISILQYYLKLRRLIEAEKAKVRQEKSVMRHRFEDERIEC